MALTTAEVTALSRNSGTRRIREDTQGHEHGANQVREDTGGPEGKLRETSPWRGPSKTSSRLILEPLC
jgi:hypothetical protein